MSERSKFFFGGGKGMKREDCSHVCRSYSRRGGDDGGDCAEIFVS